MASTCVIDPCMLTHWCNSNVDVFAWLCCISGNLKVCIQPSLKLLRHLNIHSWMMYFVERLPVPSSMLFYFGRCGEFYFGSRAKKPEKISAKYWRYLLSERPERNPLVSLVLLSVFFFPSFSFSPFSSIHEVSSVWRIIRRCWYPSARFGRWRWHTWCPWTKQWLQGVCFFRF